MTAGGSTNAARANGKRSTEIHNRLCAGDTAVAGTPAIVSTPSQEKEERR